MFEIKPWDDFDKNVFRRLTKDRVFYTDNPKLTRNLGRRYPSLFDEDSGFMDIGKINKRNKSMVALRPNCSIIPIPGSTSNPKNFRFKFYKIF